MKKQHREILLNDSDLLEVTLTAALEVPEGKMLFISSTSADTHDVPKHLRGLDVYHLNVKDGDKTIQVPYQRTRIAKVGEETQDAVVFVKRNDLVEVDDE